MRQGRFKVGMVVPAWTPRLGTGVAEDVQVVAISEDRRFLWLVDVDKGCGKHIPDRQPIENDPRFGEKVVAYSDFLHPYLRVFRADKAKRCDPVMPEYEGILPKTA